MPGWLASCPAWRLLSLSAVGGYSPPNTFSYCPPTPFTPLLLPPPSPPWCQHCLKPTSQMGRKLQGKLHFLLGCSKGLFILQLQRSGFHVHDRPLRLGDARAAAARYQVRPLLFTILHLLSTVPGSCYGSWPPGRKLPPSLRVSSPGT